MAYPTLMMPSPTATPRSRSRSNSRPNLTIRVPPLKVVHEEMTPEDEPESLPPSNSLLISVSFQICKFRPPLTNIRQRLTPDLLKDEVLALLRSLIHPHAPIWTWNLDRRRSRITISFYDTQSAQFIKDALEREPIMGCTPRITFAAPANTSPPPPQYLELPKSDKLFFISPPPSPPHGWEMRNEGPPNTDTHAHDLTAALERLDTKEKPSASDLMMEAPVRQTTEDGRGRSSSVTLVYHPEHHGCNAALPTISVEDTEADAMEICESPAQNSTLFKAAMPKTEMPPVEDFGMSQ
jgi:hypothetical protein